METEKTQASRSLTDSLRSMLTSSLRDSTLRMERTSLSNQYRILLIVLTLDTPRSMKSSKSSLRARLKVSSFLSSYTDLGLITSCGVSVEDFFSLLKKVKIYKF